VEIAELMMDQVLDRVQQANTSLIMDLDLDALNKISLGNIM